MPDTNPDHDDLVPSVAGAGRKLGFVCAPALFQRVLADCVDEPVNVDAYARNREALTRGLSALGYEYVEPQGAFYLWVRSLEPDAEAFFQRAKALELLPVPSDSFGCTGWVRLLLREPRYDRGIHGCLGAPQGAVPLMGTCTGRDGGACGGRDSRQTGCRPLHIACDVHTHTLFSRHAYSTIEENVRAAAGRHIELLGSTDHFSSMLHREATGERASGYDLRDNQYFLNYAVWPRTWHGVRLLHGCEADIVDLDGRLFGYDAPVAYEINGASLGCATTLKERLP